MVIQSKENSVGNYSTEDGTRTFYTELLHWIKEVLSENLDLMKSLLDNDLAEEKAKNLVGLDVTREIVLTPNLIELIKQIGGCY